MAYRYLDDNRESKYETVLHYIRFDIYCISQIHSIIHRDVIPIMSCSDKKHSSTECKLKKIVLDMRLSSHLG